MGIFEHFPYLNFHDINLDWLLKQTKKNASDNAFLMNIFHWFEDQGLVGTVTDITENIDNTVKIDYVTLPDGTPDDFTVYNKTGADNAISGAQSAAESYADTAAANALKSLGDLTQETTLQNTDLLLINRSGAAKSIDGSLIARQSDMTTAQNDITSLQTDMAKRVEFSKVVNALSSSTAITDLFPNMSNGLYLVFIGYDGYTFTNSQAVYTFVKGATVYAVNNIYAGSEGRTCTMDTSGNVAKGQTNTYNVTFTLVRLS